MAWVLMSDRLAFDPQRFGETLRRRMHERGATRWLVAQQTGLDESAVRRAEHGLPVSVDSIVALLYWLRTADVLQFTKVTDAEEEAS